MATPHTRNTGGEILQEGDAASPTTKRTDAALLPARRHRSIGPRPQLPRLAGSRATRPHYAEIKGHRAGRDFHREARVLLRYPEPCGSQQPEPSLVTQTFASLNGRRAGEHGSLNAG